MKRKLFTLTIAFAASVASMLAQWGNTPPLHVEGKYFVDPYGNKVVLHGVMDTPNPYFNNYRWQPSSCDDNGVSPCITYFNKLFTAITDSANRAYCDLFRLHLDPCWTNDPSKPATNGGGENDISRFSEARLKKYLRSLYFRIAKNALNRGLYVIMRPPGVFPETVRVGDEYNQYLLKVWDIVTQNDSVKKYAGQIMIELGNEPVNLRDASGNDTPRALHDFFQPIVDKMRANGYTGIILAPGTGWQSNYRSYATYPIEDDNFGYAVHNYAGWYGTSDESYNEQNCINQFKSAVPVVETNPIVITEVDWSPKNPGTGHYNEHGDWVESNYGTWATASTSKWGKAYKALLDHFGNISMTLTGTGDYIDIDKYINNRKVVPAFTDAMNANGVDPYEASGEACFRWYKEYAQVDKAHPDMKRKYTADNGFGGFVNPLINADFPDPDIILVDDTYYLCSTTMFYFPGATILKSKDLINWEYCANPLKQIANNDPYNLRNNGNNYSKGQWAPSLQYHKGKFYLNFIAYSSPGYNDGGDWILSATNPEGPWTMTKLDGFYYDSGFLFDDNRDHLHGLGPNGEENGDGYLYVAHGIDNITVSKLNPNTFKEISSTTVIRVGNGCEGSHMYHIGDYYYIYATYGGTEGSQTIFRSKSPMGPYEEHEGRVFANQRIHQGGIVETQTGEWWTILFKDAGTVGRVPYLEPIKWTDGWPVLGINGIDVSSTGAKYAKPNVGKTYPLKYLPTNDTFTTSELGLQWEWNHNPLNSAWSLLENPGHLRLHTATVGTELSQTQNMLTQRIFSYNKANTAWDKYPDSYGTISLDTYGMQDGDIAGLCVFQDPYGYIAVKQVDGKKYLVQYRSAYDSTQPQEVVAQTPISFIDGERIYLRAIVNFGTNKANFYYSLDNDHWTKFGNEMTMRYTLKIFVGNRFGIFNYATKNLGGFVDVDWFSTEPIYSEERFYGEGILPSYSVDDFAIEDLNMSAGTIALMPGTTRTLEMNATFRSGRKSNIATSCSYEISDPEVASIEAGRVVGRKEGTTTVTATYVDVTGNQKSVTFEVVVAIFPLYDGAINPSIKGSGKFTQSGTLSMLRTAKDGLGGWVYPNGIDLSQYNYIVVKFSRASTAKPEFRVYDANDLDSTPYKQTIVGKSCQIDLHNMTKSDGKICDPSKIYMAGFSTDGTAAVYITEIFLSNDGVNPVAIEGIEADGLNIVNSEYYTIDGRRTDKPQQGVVIRRVVTSDGKVKTEKVFMK